MWAFMYANAFCLLASRTDDATGTTSPRTLIWKTTMTLTKTKMTHQHGLRTTKTMVAKDKISLNRTMMTTQTLFALMKAGYPGRYHVKNRMVIIRSLIRRTAV